MKKLSTSMALAALLGAASLSTPADAFSFDSLKKSASDVFSVGKDLASKVVHSDEFKEGAKTVGNAALDLGKNYVEGKLAGGSGK